MAKNDGNILDCLAEAYRLDLDDGAYVQNLANTVQSLLDYGPGILAYTYDASDPTEPVIDHYGTSSRFDPGGLEAFYAAVERKGIGAAFQPIGFIGWGHMLCNQASRVPEMRPYLPMFSLIGGSRDAFAVNALDTSGRGLFLCAPMLNTRKASDKQYTLFTRLAVHLIAATRLRRTSGRKKPKASAVLAAGGELLHAEKLEGVVEAREDLRRATRAFDEARTKKMRNDVETATMRWRPLVVSRWSLLDDFDTDGKRFVVAVENAPATKARKKNLSERELQVMTHAQLGHSDKVIAYELGLSHSTVRVLMHRAVQKLGASSRRDAISVFSGIPKR